MTLRDIIEQYPEMADLPLRNKNMNAPLIIDDTKTIKFWYWQDAPEYYKAFSKHGGDEDWICFIPESLITENSWFPQFDEGCYNPDVMEYDVPGGKIRICAHA